MRLRSVMIWHIELGKTLFNRSYHVFSILSLNHFIILKDCIVQPRGDYHLFPLGLRYVRCQNLIASQVFRCGFSWFRRYARCDNLIASQSFNVPLNLSLGICDAIGDMLSLYRIVCLSMICLRSSKIETFGSQQNYMDCMFLNLKWLWFVMCVVFRVFLKHFYLKSKKQINWFLFEGFIAFYKLKGPYFLFSILEYN